MSSTPNYLQVRIHPSIYAKVKAQAKAEMRSVTQQVNILLERGMTK